MVGNTSIFEFYTTVNFALSVDFDLQTYFNLKIETLEIADITITLNNFGVADIEILNSYVSSALDAYLTDENNWQLFKNGVPLSNVFNEINNWHDQTTGVLFAGVPKTNLQLDIMEKILLNL